jgi:hypothetical protein
MGVCCGQKYPNEELNECKTINEIIELLNKKRESFKSEIIQIEDYLEDSNKTVEFINVKGIDKKVLQKRIPYLRDLNNAYEHLAEILEKNPNLPLNETKNHVNTIISFYHQIYDPNGDLAKNIKYFEDFVHKQNKQQKN